MSGVEPPPPPPLGPRLRFAALWLVVVALFLALRLPALLRYAPTRPEAHWIGAGHELLTEGPAAVPVLSGTPPLAAHLIDLPLWAFEQIPTESGDDATPAPGSAATRLLYASRLRGTTEAVPHHLVLLAARLPVLLLGLLGLELIRRVGRRLFDARSGWIAAFAWAAHPALAGWGVLAAPPVIAAVVALLLLAALVDYHDVAGRRSGTAKARLVRLGIVAGLTLAVSRELLLAVIVVAVASPIWRASLVRREEPVRPGALSRFVGAALLACLTVWVCYGFEWRPPGDTALHVPTAELSVATGLDSVTLHDLFRDHALPAGSYVRSLASGVVRLFGAGDPPALVRPETTSYLGALLRTWPLAFTLFALLGVAGWRGVRGDRADVPDLVLVLALLPLLIGAFIVPAAGAAHAVATLPFLILLGAAALARMRLVRPWAARGALVTLTLLLAVEWLPHLTDPLAFAQPLATSSVRSTPFLPHHSPDLGQDLDEVLAWTDGRGVEELTTVLGADRDVLAAAARERPWLAVDPGPGDVLADEARAESRTDSSDTRRLLAVSPTALASPPFDRLADVEPLVQVGRTRIYRLSPPPEPAQDGLPAGAIPPDTR